MCTKSCTHSDMSITKDDIKAWVDSPQRGRAWLAEQCGVSTRTVGNWLTVSNIEVPAKSLRIIEQLMRDGAQEDATQNLVLEIGNEKFDAYNKAALKHGMLIKEWLVSIVDAAIDAESKPIESKPWQPKNPPKEHNDPSRPEPKTEPKRKVE